VLEVLAPGFRLLQRLLPQLLLLLQKSLLLQLLLQLIVMTEIAHEFLQILDLVAKSMSLSKQMFCQEQTQSVPEHWVQAHSCTDLTHSAVAIPRPSSYASRPHLALLETHACWSHFWRSPWVSPNSRLRRSASDSAISAAKRSASSLASCTCISTIFAI
jgi:hypothetical protein